MNTFFTVNITYEIGTFRFFFNEFHKIKLRYLGNCGLSLCLYSIDTFCLLSVYLKQ